MSISIFFSSILEQKADFSFLGRGHIKPQMSC